MSETVIRFISLVVGRILAQPKRVAFLLAALLIFILILGNFLGTISHESAYLLTPTLTKPAYLFFDLHPVRELDYTSTPKAMITPSSVSLNKKTPLSTPDYCRSQLLAGTFADVNYVGGNTITLSVRTGLGGSGDWVGELHSGDSIYLLSGPVCDNTSTWWKINSGDKKIIGWIPEKIGDRIILSLPRKR